MSSSSDDSSSDSDGTVENFGFGIPVATQPLPTPQLQGLRIRDHVLSILDYEKDNYGLWSRQFLTSLCKFGLRDHIDGSPAQGTSDWVLNDFAIVSWYDGTVAPSTLSIVNTRDVTARALWRSLRAVFRDNRDTRATFLRDEFHGFNQGDLSVVDYMAKMKDMADTLGDLGSRVRDRELIHNVLRGLDQRLQHAVPHMTRGRLPNFIKLRSFLRLEEQRLDRQARVVAHNALLAQAYHAAGAPAPAHLAQAYNVAGGYAAPPHYPEPHAVTNPAPPAFNPAALGLHRAGASHAGAQAGSSGSTSGNGKKKRKKNPAPSGSASHSGAPNPGTLTGYRAPAPRPAQPSPAAPTLAGTFQAWSSSGLLGSRPPAPRALNTDTNAGPSWDQSALIAALNQMSMQAAPAAGGTANQGGEWVFDSGASSHMCSSPVQPQLNLEIMQPAQQPFRPLVEAVPGTKMGMPAQMQHFLHPEHHIPIAGHVLPATQVVLPPGYIPMMNAPMLPIFDSNGTLWFPVLDQPWGTTRHQSVSAALPSVSSTQPSSLDWGAYTTTDGKKYYYNKRTKFSSCEKPSELMTPLERAEAATDWKEYITAQGLRYYHNKMTNKSVWTIPDELKRARELEEKASAQQPNRDTQTTAGSPVGSTSVSGEPGSLPANGFSYNMVGIVAPRTHDAVVVTSERFDRVVDLIHL